MQIGVVKGRPALVQPGPSLLWARLGLVIENPDSGPSPNKEYMYFILIYLNK